MTDATHTPAATELTAETVVIAPIGGETTPTTEPVPPPTPPTPPTPPATPAKPKLSVAQRLAAGIVTIEKMETELKAIVAEDGPGAVEVLTELAALGSALPPSLQGLTGPGVKALVNFTNLIKEFISYT